MKRVYSSQNSALVGLAKSLLDAARIPCEMRNEAFSQAIPVIPFEAELWVARDEDYEEALRLIESRAESSGEMDAGRPLVVFENEQFVVEGTSACSIPGYLIVSPKAPTTSLSDMSAEALTALGPTLAAATKALERVLDPERVYCAFFGEETQAVHFHLFPRTPWLAAEYLKAHPGETVISGPRLLDWARQTCATPLIGADEVLQRIRDNFPS